jgi:hypothetical protein
MMHAALNNGVLDIEHFSDFSFHNVNCLLSNCLNI